MRVIPKTDEQITEEERLRKESFLWEDGYYDFEIVSAIESRSKKDNEMIVLDLKNFSVRVKNQIKCIRMNLFAFLLFC